MKKRINVACDCRLIDAELMFNVDFYRRVRMGRFKELSRSYAQFGRIVSVECKG
jgi:hypothetical protein